VNISLKCYSQALVSFKKIFALSIIIILRRTNCSILHYFTDLYEYRLT